MVKCVRCDVYDYRHFCKYCSRCGFPFLHNKSTKLINEINILLKRCQLGIKYDKEKSNRKYTEISK